MGYVGVHLEDEGGAWQTVEGLVFAHRAKELRRRQHLDPGGRQRH